MLSVAEDVRVNHRLEKLIERAARRAHLAGDNVERWVISCRRVQRLKAMRDPELVAQLDAERLQRCRRS